MVASSVGRTIATAVARAVAGIGGGGGSSVDPDAAAFIARMSVAPSTEQASIYDSFVKSAKSIGVWDYITDCGFLCAHTDQASKLGVKDVINLTNVGGGPTHYPGYGVRGNGSSTALDTGYKFPSNQQHNASMGVYCAEELSATATGDMGNGNSLIACGLGSASASSFAFRINAASSTSVVQTDTMGFYRANRSSVTEGLKRGVQSGTGFASETPDATYNIYICGVNRASPLWSTRMLSYWDIGTAVPEELHQAYSDLVELTVTRIAALQTVAASLTPETRNMYRFFISHTRKQDYLVGNFDNRYWPLDTTGRVFVEEFETITGEKAALYSHEWVDPDNDATESAAQLARIKAQYAAGHLISLHHHPGNPVTGSLSLAPQPLEDPPITGSHIDRSGAPVVAILEGGSERQQFLDYVDRLIAFLNSCVTDGGQKIPIMLRWWHEIDHQGFWWSDSVPANTVQLWQDFVDRILAAGVNHVLFDFARDYQEPFVDSQWWPGDDYVDIHSASAYQNNTATPTGQSSFLTKFGQLLNSSRVKPRWHGEAGYNPASETDMTLWSEKTGYVIRDSFPDAAGILLWRAPWGPAVGNVNNQSLIDMTDDTSAIVQSRLSGVYTLPSIASVGNWWFDNAIVDLDFTNNRFRYNGTNYTSFADLITAGFATEVSGIKRVVLSGLLPAAYSVVASGVTSATTTVGGTAQYLVTLDDGDDGAVLDEAVVMLRQALSSQDRLAAAIYAAGTAYPATTENMASDVAIAGGCSFALRVKANDFAGSFNNAAVDKVTTVPMPTITQMVIADRQDGARPWGGTVSRIAILNTELSDAQLATFW